MAKHGRNRTDEPPDADPLPLALGDVYLLTAESGGEEAVGGLGLVLDHDGVTVLGPSGTPAAAIEWSQITSLRTGGRTIAPGGRPAVVLEATTARRTHRFAVPTNHATDLETAIDGLAWVPVTDPPRRRRRRLRP